MKLNELIEDLKWLQAKVDSVVYLTAGGTP